MQIEQGRWTDDGVFEAAADRPDFRAGEADLVLVFGDVAATHDTALAAVRRRYPRGHLLGCSTAGEILETRISDTGLVTTAVRFDSIRIQAATAPVETAADSLKAGQALAAALPHEGLVHVLLVSDGLHVNGSDLVRGITDGLPAGTSVTGGLAGDGERFAHTTVVSGTSVGERLVGAVGLYGSRLRVRSASLGGWDQFGAERRISRAQGNVLYELDGRSALELYKTYLGEYAERLPASALLFPLAVRVGANTPVVRTVLAVDEEAGSMTFAGDMPEGAYARLMKANFDRLVRGARGAAESCAATELAQTDLALLISCVGRRLVLRQRTEEEIEAVQQVLGTRAALTGFYSYGEISPFTPTARCELHNQTMTVTTVSEIAA